MIDLDFVEIGTSDFDTLAESMPDSAGMSIEPLKCYLDRLPTRPNLIKVNCAISATDQTHPIDVYYIPPHVLEEHNYLPSWLRGCNCVETMHLQHRAFAVEHLVVKETVQAVPLAKLLADHNVRSIKYLKLDTEGQDSYILEQFYYFLQNSPTHAWPKKIKFETNELSPQEQNALVIKLYQNIGYQSVPHDQDTELLLQENTT